MFSLFRKPKNIFKQTSYREVTLIFLESKNFVIEFGFRALLRAFAFN